MRLPLTVHLLSLVLIFAFIGLTLALPLEIIIPLRSDDSHVSSASSSSSYIDGRSDVDSIADAPLNSQSDERDSRQLSHVDSGDKPKLNVLEVIKGMGSAIQLLIRQHNHQGDSRADAINGEVSKEQYREQAEHLRSEINRRSGQLQKVVGAAIEAMKDRGDIVMGRILENLQSRLGQAKQRADKILKEPESGELAVRTLNSINQGMSNLSNLVQHVLSRVNISINVDLKDNQGISVKNLPTTGEQSAPAGSSVSR